MFACVLLAIMLQGGQLFQDFVHTLETTPMKKRAPLVRTFLAHRQTPIIEQDSLLHFVWFGQAKSVFVAGALPGSWQVPVSMTSIPCGGDSRSPSLFYRSYAVPPDSRIEYKFVIDGVYTLDPTNRRTTPPSDYLNSEAAMPRFSRSPLTRYRTGIEHGTTDTLWFRSKDTAIAPRLVRVYVPPGYSHSVSMPVVYVHDGETAFRYSFLTTIIDNLIADGRIPPTIAVFVPPVERGSEYHGKKTPSFVRAFCDELVPMIDNAYRSSPNPKDRAVMGISSGGSIALTLAIVRPDCFGCVAGQSSAIHSIVTTALIAREFTAPMPRDMKIWIDCGTYDIVEDSWNLLALNRSFVQTLAECGISCTYREIHDGHDWANWRERMPEIVCFFFTR